MSSASHHLEAAARAMGRGLDAVATHHLRALVRIVPAVPVFWALLGDRLLAQDAFDAALHAYRRARDLLDRQGVDAACPECRTTLARLHAAIASAHAGAGDLERAVEAYRLAIRLDPSPRNYVDLGEIHEMRGQPGRARACYRKAYRRDETYLPALMHLAELDLWTHPERVRQLCQKALAQDPNHADALTNLAAVHMQHETWAQAQDCVEASLHARPTARAWVYAGHLRLQRGEVAGAREAYGRAGRLDPGDVHPLYALGDLEWEEGDVPAAELAYREALALDPGSADAALRLARLLIESGGRREEGLALARRGLRRAPHHPWADHVRRWLAGRADGAASA